MKKEDIEVLKTVYENFDKYTWEKSTSDDNFNSALNFPSNAEKNFKSNYSHITEGLTIVTGTYSYRFYYEEDAFSWDKMYFAAILSTEEDDVSQITFITNEDYNNEVRRNNSVPIFIDYAKDIPNLIVDLYDSANRKVNAISKKYDFFLKKD